MPDNFINIENLYFSKRDRPVFNGITVAVPKRKVVAVMGPSGTGKTTLLNLISGQLSPDKGQINVAGKEISTLSRSALYDLRKKMGMLFQAGGLFTDLTVFENVAFPLREHTQLTESMIHTLVLLKLEMVGLRGAHYLMPHELSGGMTKRVALARAVIMDPKLVMYDEPFAGQDPVTVGVIARLIRNLNDILGLTSIVVSHDVPETLGIADYVYVMSGGKIIGQGTPATITHEADERLQQFLHGHAEGPVPFHYPAPYLSEALLGEKC